MKSETKRNQLKQRARKAHRDGLRWQRTGFSRGVPKGLLPPLTIAARVSKDGVLCSRLADAWRDAWMQGKFQFGYHDQKDPSKAVENWMRQKATEWKTQDN